MYKTTIEKTILFCFWSWVSRSPIQRNRPSIARPFRVIKTAARAALWRNPTPFLPLPVASLLCSSPPPTPASRAHESEERWRTGLALPWDGSPASALPSGRERCHRAASLRCQWACAALSSSRGYTAAAVAAVDAPRRWPGRSSSPLGVSFLCGDWV